MSEQNGEGLVGTVVEALELIDFLSGKQWEPTKNKDISAALGWNPAKTTRMLKTLESKGYAEQTGDGWRLSPKLVRLAIDYMESSRDAAKDWHDFFTRFTGMSRNRF